MSTTTTEAHFDPDNRAWQRLTAVAEEHLDVATWTRPDGRPIMLTVVDLHTGDAVTLAVLDSLEVREPHVLLAITTTDELTVHGPIDGGRAAAGHAPHLALTDLTIQATQAAPLHHPATTAIPDSAWVDLPPVPVTVPAPAGTDYRAVAAVLFDPVRQRLAAVGPFPNPAAADRWQPDDTATAERHVTALWPIVPETPTPQP